MTMTRRIQKVARQAWVDGIGMGLAESILTASFLAASLLAASLLAASLLAASLLAASLLTASVSRAQAADEGEDAAQARAIIDKAVKAHGGADKLSQFKAVSAKWFGKHKIENEYYGDAVRFVTYEMPTDGMPVKIRIDFDVENPKGSNFAFSRVVNGKKGWQGSGQRTRDLKDAEVTQIVDEFYAHWLASVVPLKDIVLQKENGFEFSVFGNVAVDGKDAVGVWVTCKGRPDVILSFDKETGLVIKSGRRAKDPVTNEEYSAESIYRDHKAFQGVMWPTNRLDRRDGKDLEEDSGRFELSAFQAHDKLEVTSLARP